MRGSLCCLLLTLFAWGCGPEEGKKVELKDLMFKCVITNPVEDEVIRVSINGKEQVFEVPENGVVEIKASRIAPTVLGGDVRTEGLSRLLGRRRTHGDGI